MKNSSFAVVVFVLAGLVGGCSDVHAPCGDAGAAPDGGVDVDDGGDGCDPLDPNACLVCARLCPWYDAGPR